MSTLLEQAIVDAEALKEAAIKNAEAAIIEKYSSEVRDAVNSLLEQEEDTLEEEEESSVMEEVPYAVEEGDEPIMVRLDLEALERALSEEEEPVEESHEDLADTLEEEIEEALETEGEETDLDEEIELDEEILDAIAEELKVDLGIPDQGLGGRSTPTDRNLEGQKVTLAALKDDELAEEHAALQKAREETGMYVNQVNELKQEKSNLEKTVLIGTTTNTGSYKIDVAGKQRVQDTLELDDVLMLNAISTPSDPEAGKSVIYMDSSDGGIKCKINVGGTTVTRTLASFE